MVRVPYENQVSNEHLPKAEEELSAFEEVIYSPLQQRVALAHSQVLWMRKSVTL